MKNIFGICLLMILFAFASCGRNKPVSQMHTFTNANRERFDYMNFALPVEYSDKAYDISVVIKYTAKFPADALK